MSDTKQEEWYVGDNDEDYSSRDYDITSTPNDFNILTLCSTIEKGIIKLPPFQRNYVWNQKKASKFIESIILGLPFPQIFLYEEKKNNYYIIDGQQRLMSIYFFIKQRFPNAEGRNILRSFSAGEKLIDPEILNQDKYFNEFKLDLVPYSSTEENRLNGVSYSQFDDDKKQDFDFLRTIRTIIIRQNSPEDNSSMYEIFARLNSGGENLRPQEIRLSLYFSDFLVSLSKLNENEIWRKILNKDKLDIHFKDIEIILRAFALLEKESEYQPTMTRFLNDYAKHATNFEQSYIEYLHNLFESFLNSSSTIIKEYVTGEKSKRFNISLFIAVFVAVCDKFFDEKSTVSGQITLESIRKLKSDTAFNEASQEGVASAKNVKKRLERARKIIKLK